MSMKLCVYIGPYLDTPTELLDLVEDLDGSELWNNSEVNRNWYLPNRQLDIPNCREFTLSPSDVEEKYFDGVTITPDLIALECQALLTYIEGMVGVGVFTAANVKWGVITSYW